MLPSSQFSVAAVIAPGIDAGSRRKVKESGLDRGVFPGQFQLPEFPSVPYTPSNFWKTMSRIEGIEAIVGQEPAAPTKMKDYREDSYDGVFYHHPSNVAVHYHFQKLDQEATVALYGQKFNVDILEEKIREEHRKTL